MSQRKILSKVPLTPQFTTNGPKSNRNKIQVLSDPEQTIGLRNRVIFSDSLLSVEDSIIIGFNLQTKFFKYSFQTNNDILKILSFELGLIYEIY
jgi:hypothetical protein